MRIALRDINKKGVEIGERQNRCQDDTMYTQLSGIYFKSKVQPVFSISQTPKEYLYKPWVFDTIPIYLYMCVILLSVNISE